MTILWGYLFTPGLAWLESQTGFAGVKSPMGLSLKTGFALGIIFIFIKNMNIKFRFYTESPKVGFGLGEAKAEPSSK